MLLWCCTSQLNQKFLVVTLKNILLRGSLSYVFSGNRETQEIRLQTHHREGPGSATRLFGGRQSLPSLHDPYTHRTGCERKGSCFSPFSSADYILCIESLFSKIVRKSVRVSLHSVSFLEVPYKKYLVVSNVSFSYQSFDDHPLIYLY